MNAQNLMYLESKKPKTNHILHLILSLVTAGLWVPFWLLVSISNSIECSKIDRKIKKVVG